MVILIVYLSNEHKWMGNIIKAFYNKKSENKIWISLQMQNPSQDQWKKWNVCQGFEVSKFAAFWQNTTDLKQ